MRPLMCAMVAGVMLTGATVGVDSAEAGGSKRGRYRAAYDDRYDRDDRHDRRYDDRDRYERYDRYDRYPRDRYITHREVRVIREYYGPRYRHLPRGVRKHYYRRGYLPVGWQRRIHPYPAHVREVVVLPRGYRRGVIDGHAVIYNSRGMIIDLAVVF